MGVALGWLALSLAVAGAPDAGRGSAPITYTVRFVEVEGLGWRDDVLARLTPVTRQGSATVWTAPADVAQRVARCASKSSSAQQITAPKVTGWPGAPVHITTRTSRQLVTQVAWNGEDRPLEVKPETVRTGSAATLAGRKLDQGILARVVLQDTQILSVHRVPLGGSKESSSDPAATKAADHSGDCDLHADLFDYYRLLWAKKAADHSGDCDGTPKCGESNEDHKRTTTLKWSFQWNLGGHQGLTLPTGRYMYDDTKFLAVPNCSDDQTRTAMAEVKAAAGTDRPAPKEDGGFVPASAADSDCCTAATACTSCPGTSGRTTAAVKLEVPEIASEEIAGEWLIPNGGILLVSFGPHTVADKGGKAVIRERLAILEAAEAPNATMDQATIPPGPIPAPLAGRLNLIVPPPASLIVMPAPAPAGDRPPMPGIPAAIAPPTVFPPMPSRSIPQGYHADGKAADRPPLPADEFDDPEGPSPSAEPRPSPQVKKPRPSSDAKETPHHSDDPAADTATKKAQFPAPGSFPVIPTLFQPAPTVGLQFLIPIKPVSFKLPFNRRLELEVYGRVVNAPEPARGSADLATKDGKTTK